MKKLLTLIVVLILYNSCKGQNKYSEWFDLNLKNRPFCIIEFEYFPLSDYSEEEFSHYMDSSLNYLTSRKTTFYDTLGFIKRENFKEIMENETIELTGNRLEKYFYKDSIITTVSSEHDDIVNFERIYLNENGFSTKRMIKHAGFENSWYIRNNENRIVEVHSEFWGIDTGGEAWEYFTLNKNGDAIKKIEKANLLKFQESSTFIDTTYYTYVYDQYKNWVLRTTEKNGKITIITERKIKY